jgi:hypothetical protein
VDLDPNNVVVVGRDGFHPAVTGPRERATGLGLHRVLGEQLTDAGPDLVRQW